MSMKYYRKKRGEMRKEKRATQISRDGWSQNMLGLKKEAFVHAHRKHSRSCLCQEPCLCYYFNDVAPDGALPGIQIIYLFINERFLIALISRFFHIPLVCFRLLKKNLTLKVKFGETFPIV